MNFPYPKDTHWFIPKNHEKISEIKLIQVEIHEDSARTLLAIKKDSFIGIFDSVEELNKKMEEDKYINIEKITLNSEKKSIKEISIEIINSSNNINKIELEFVKENFNSKPIYNINFLRRQKLNNIFNKTRKVFLEFIKDFNLNEEEVINIIPKSSDDRYLTIDLTNWSKKEKEVLFTDCLSGIYYYHVIHTQKTSFDFGTYRTIYNALNGNNKVEIYKESIKWFNFSIKEKLKQKNYQFPDLKYPNNYITRHSSRDIQDQVNDFYKDDDQMGEWRNSHELN